MSEPESSQLKPPGFRYMVVEKLFGIVSGVSDRWVLITGIVVAGVSYCVWIWRVPSEEVADRGPWFLARMVSTLAASNLVGLTGWGLFLAACGVSFIVARAQYRQNVKQGEIIKSFRDAQRPERVSSHAPEVKEAVTRMVSKKKKGG